MHQYYPQNTLTPAANAFPPYIGQVGPQAEMSFPQAQAYITSEAYFSHLVHYQHSGWVEAQQYNAPQCDQWATMLPEMGSLDSLKSGYPTSTDQGGFWPSLPSTSVVVDALAAPRHITTAFPNMHVGNTMSNGERNINKKSGFASTIANCDFWSYGPSGEIRRGLVKGQSAPRKTTKAPPKKQSSGDTAYSGSYSRTLRWKEVRMHEADAAAAAEKAAVVSRARGRRGTGPEFFEFKVILVDEEYKKRLVKPRRQWERRAN